ncbi:MAG: hypothetical protein JXX14_21030 [Deltaproteobacteria bacterium]|nr:hypothetical protein [Deltaproteobacteria bacterium]
MLSLVEARYIQRSIADANIVVASNGASTLELARARHPDVTILDTELTEIDALTLHRSLCDIVSPDSILVTSNQPAPAFFELKREGKISELLIRPFPISDLISQVEHILVSHGIEVMPYRSSIPPTPMATPEFDRHLALNQLSGMLGALRAFEAEVEAEGNAPPNIQALMDEYVPRIVNLIQDVAQNIKRSRKNEMRQ